MGLKRIQLKHGFVGTLATLTLVGCAPDERREVRVFPPAPEFPPGHRYTLDELCEAALHHNASLDVARYEAEAARGLVDQVKALWLPTLRYNFAAIAYANDLNFESRAFDIATVNVPLTGSYNLTNSLLSTYIVYTGGKRTSGLKQAKMFAAIKELDILRQQDAVLQDVATFYQLVCLTSQVDAILEETIRRLRVFEQVARELNERGSLRAGETDALQAEFVVLQLEQLQLALRAGRGQAYAALRTYVGLPRDADVPLASTDLPDGPPPEVVLSAYQQVAQGFVARPESRQVNLFAEIRAEQVRFVKASWQPNVIFVGSGIVTAGNNANILSAINGLIASVIIDVPLYDPARRGRLREALGLEYAADAFRRQVEELITLEIEVTAIEAQRALASLFKAYRAREVAAEHYEATRSAYTREIVSPDAVVVAIVLDMLARVQYEQAVYAYENSRAALKRVTADRTTPYGY